MGGLGSGLHWAGRRKSTVGQGCALDINWLTREGVFDRSGPKAGGLSWTSGPYQKEKSSISYEVNIPLRWMRLHYRLVRTGENIDYLAPLTTTRLSWGGIRWWFTCPLIRNAQNCDRQVGKLYRPSGCRYFGCRHCYDLTYTSCQESHRYDKIFKMTGEELGVPGFNAREELAFWKWEAQYERRGKRNEQRRRRRKALNWS